MGQRPAVADEVFQKRLYGNTASPGLGGKARCGREIPMLIVGQFPAVFCILSHAFLPEG